MDRTLPFRFIPTGLILVALGSASCAVSPDGSPVTTNMTAGDKLVAAGATTANLAPQAEVAAELPAAPADEIAPFTVCTDGDGDGRGQGCAAGPDCDDSNATVTDECTLCIVPDEGCECDPSAAPVPCGSTATGACATGVRVCDGGHWTACLNARVDPIIAAGPANCPGLCDPTCRQIVDCPNSADAMPAGSSNVAFGTQTAATFCPTGAAAGGITPTCTNAAGGPYVRATSPALWVDACAAAGSTRILVSSDEGVTPMPIPFTFQFYGTPYTSARISANGYLSFSDAAPQWVNTMLPSSTAPNSIFPFWDDQVQRAAGVCVATTGTAPNRTFVAEWVDGTFFPSNATDVHLTYEVMLSETTNTIDVRYLTMTGEANRSSGDSATVGVQQAAGSSFDQVGYNTANVATPGAGFRWTPATSTTRCQSGVFRRVFQGTCIDNNDPTVVPIWGQLTYTATTPTGSAIHFEVRAADTSAALASAVAYRLPDAPRGMTAGSAPASLNLGAWLRAVQPRLERANFVEIRAYLDPGAAFDTPPTLGSTQLQFNCVPSETPSTCRSGASCFVTNTCHRGQIQCDAMGRPVCTDMGTLAAGTSCGNGQYCTSGGICSDCPEGAACSLSNACAVGRVSCASGAPVCVTASNSPAGTVCNVSNSGNYVRGTSPFGFFDACAAPGHTTVLAGSSDGTENVPMAFPFNYYGTQRTSVSISANGYLAFPTAPVNWVNTALPQSSFGDAVLPFWDDLIMRDGVCVATFGAAPQRTFVVEWSNADLEGRGSTANAGARLSFEVAFEELSQSVSVIYGTMTGDTRATGSGATIGIQSADNTRKDQIGYNTANAVMAGTSFRWTPPVSGICNGSGTCMTCSGTETCDGVDNNCDALIDNNIPDVSCGVGACRRTVSGCVRGSAPTCTPGTPTTEICNTIDDNCNGVVDEGCSGAIACPANLTMFAGDTTTLNLATTGTVTGITWSITSGPTGGASSAVWNPNAPTSTTETFRPIIVGAYAIHVAARNGFNQTLGCDFTLTAQGRGIRVELTWDGAGDIDIHGHNNVTTSPWFNTTNDTFYAHLSSAWGAVQDVDNVTSNGPENIRIDTPTIGADYTFAVHHYANGAGRRATLKIYCGGGTTPVNTYTSNALTGTQAGNCTNNSFWRVARVNANSSGGCTVTPILTYSTSSNACSTF